MHHSTLRVTKEIGDDTKVSLQKQWAKIDTEERKIHQLSNFGNSFEFVGRKQGCELLQIDGGVFGCRFAQRDKICPKHAALSKAVLNNSLRYFFDLEEQILENRNPQLGREGTLATARVCSKSALGDIIRMRGVSTHWWRCRLLLSRMRKIEMVKSFEFVRKTLDAMSSRKIRLGLEHA